MDRGDVDHASGDGALLLETAQAERRVRVVDVFPGDSHPPITCPVALTAHARPEAARLVELLVGDAARQIFVPYGFTVPPGPRSGK